LAICESATEQFILGIVSDLKPASHIPKDSLFVGRSPLWSTTPERWPVDQKLKTHCSF